MSLALAFLGGLVARAAFDWERVPLRDEGAPKGTPGGGTPSTPGGASSPSSGSSAVRGSPSPLPSSPSSSSTPTGPSAAGPSPGARAVLVPKVATGAAFGPASRVPGVADRIRAVWRELFGAEIPPAALEIALAQAWLESGVADSSGGWWADKTSKGAGNMVGSGNLGARQCGTNDKGGPAWDCVPYGDSRPATAAEIAAGKPAQIQFPVDFRYYKAGTIGGKPRSKDEAAAYDFVQSITKQWPAKAELESGDVLAYARKQYANHYYGGFGATPEERIAGYAKAIADHLPNIAAALGQTTVNAWVPADAIASAKSHATSAVAGWIDELAGDLGGPHHWRDDEDDCDEIDRILDMLRILGPAHPRHWRHLID